MAGVLVHGLLSDEKNALQHVDDKEGGGMKVGEGGRGPYSSLVAAGSTPDTLYIYSASPEVYYACQDERRF